MMRVCLTQSAWLGYRQAFSAAHKWGLENEREQVSFNYKRKDTSRKQLSPEKLIKVRY